MRTWRCNDNHLYIYTSIRNGLRLISRRLWGGGAVDLTLATWRSQRKILDLYKYKHTALDTPPFFESCRSVSHSFSPKEIGVITHGALSN